VFYFDLTLQTYNVFVRPNIKIWLKRKNWRLKQPKERLNLIDSYFLAWNADNADNADLHGFLKISENPRYRCHLCSKKNAAFLFARRQLFILHFLRSYALTFLRSFSATPQKIQACRFFCK
jgi:hypothetical protein